MRFWIFFVVVLVDKSPTSVGIISYFVFQLVLDRYIKGYICFVVLGDFCYMLCRMSIALHLLNEVINDPDFL